MTSTGSQSIRGDSATELRTTGNPAARQSVCSRNAFTLLEVMLALGLMTVLLAAVFTAMDFYARYTTDGMDEMEQARITRAVLTQFSTDLRSVVFQVADELSIDETEMDETSVTDTTVAEPTTPDQAFFQDSVGLTGTMDELVLTISRPSRDFRFGLVKEFDTDNSDQLSDLKSVWYFLAETGRDGIAGEVARNADPPEAVNSQIKGLGRLEGDQLAIRLASETGGMASMAEQADLLAPEINSLQFRYVADGEYFEEWDSVSNGRLPQAVEIVIGFREPDEARAEGYERLSIGGSIGFQRVVVALPLADHLSAAGL